jgi:hypothetical protein
MKNNSILHIDDTARFRQRMDRNYLHKYERILSMPNVTSYDLNCPKEALLGNSYDLLIVGVFPNSGYDFLLDGAVEPQKLSHIPIKCAVFEDIRDETFQGGWRALCEHLNQHYNFVISTYDCEELEYIKAHCPDVRQFFVLPHFINTDICHDYNLPKTWDVLLYGNVRANMYPFRLRLKNLLHQSDLSVKIIAHPGYADYKSQVCGINLARLINQAKITIATPTSSDYLIAKYFEISAAKSMVGGQMASQGKSIWQDNYVHLDDQMSDTEIIDRLKNALHNQTKLDSSVQNMYSIVHKNYDLDAFIQAFEVIIDSMIIAGEPTS